MKALIAAIPLEGSPDPQAKPPCSYLAHNTHLIETLREILLLHQQDIKFLYC